MVRRFFNVGLKILLYYLLVFFWLLKLKYNGKEKSNLYDKFYFNLICNCKMFILLLCVRYGYYFEGFCNIKILLYYSYFRFES